MADTQIAESIFSAIDTIVNKRLENLPYDKTILATIEDNSKATQGDYMVNDGSSSMRAYSDYTDYNVGDQVYVSIPLGDMTQQKIIIGKYNIDNANGTPLGYHDPLDNLIDITGNIFDSEESTFGLIANGEQLETKTICSWVAKENQNNPFSAFNILAISAGFKSSVGTNTLVVEGNYGLRLDLKTIKKATQISTEKVVYYSFYLDSNEFFGNQYNFETFYTQSKLLNLKEQDISRIDAMRLVFYQEKNFRDNYGDLIDIVDYNNLEVSDIDIRFGYDLNDFLSKDNAIILYTFDTKTYVNDITPNLRQQYGDKYNFDAMTPEEKQAFFNEINQKVILCRWVNKDEDGNLTIYGADDEYNYLPEGATIRWYRYNAQAQTDASKYSDPPGDFWEEIDPENTRDQFEILFTPQSATTATEKIKVVIWNPTQEYVEETLEINNEYLEAEQYYWSSEYLRFNFDPLEFFRLCLSDPVYQAFLRYKSIKSQECNGNTDFITISNFLNVSIDNEGNPIIPTTNYWYNNYQYINEKYEELFSHDNDEDVFIICSSIKRQVQLLKDFLTIFSFRYFNIQQTPLTFESFEEKLEKELEITRDFYVECVSNLSYFKQYIFCDNDGANNWRSQLITIMQDYANDFNNNNPGWYIAPDSINFISNPIYLNDATHYNSIIQYLDEILNECNKPATDTTKDYNKIKDKFTELYSHVEELADDYYNHWYTENTNLASVYNQMRYRQVYFYTQFSDIHDEDAQDKDNIEMSIKGSAKYATSDILEFTNEDEKAWLDYSSVKDLALEVDVANQHGVYRFYNPDGSIMNDGETQIVRIITAKYTNPMTGTEPLDSAAEKIIWKIPRHSTMIVKPEEGYEYRAYDFASPTATSFSQGQYYVYNSSTEGYDLATTYTINTQYYVKNNIQVTQDNDYYIISRQMPTRDTGTYGQEVPCSTELGFRVRNYYMPDSQNNTIYCTVIKNDKSIEASATLYFGVQGLIGTDYTLITQYENNTPFVEFQGDPVKLVSKLYDQQGNEIDAGTITYSWYHAGNGGLSLSGNTIIPSKSEINIENCAHYIVRVKASNISMNVNGTSLTLSPETYFPVVVVKKNFSYVHEGVTETENIVRYAGKGYITYDNTGVNPQYYKDPFRIYGINSSKVLKRLTNSITWGVIYTEACKRNGTVDKRFFPNMDTSNNTLVVPSIYLNNGENEITSVVCRCNGQIIFILPLYISYRVYDSTILNSWDGSLTLDKENGTILSTMMGAGEKDGQNRFHGVLMGRVNSKMGLFGYHEGVQSFGFNIDGTAFIGKQGWGQIQFDSNNGGVIKSNNFNGTITSAGVVTNYGDQGTYLNLANGILITNQGHFRGNLTVGSTISIGLNNDGTYNFYVDQYGNMAAKGNASFQGNITGSTITGSTVIGGKLLIGLKEDASETSTLLEDYNCSIDTDGSFFANDAMINGSISSRGELYVGGEYINVLQTLAQGKLTFIHPPIFDQYGNEIEPHCEAEIGFDTVNRLVVKTSNWGNSKKCVTMISSEGRVVLYAGTASITLQGEGRIPGYGDDGINTVQIHATSGIYCDGKIHSDDVIECSTTMRVNKKGAANDKSARFRAINDVVEARLGATDKGENSRAGVFCYYPQWVFNDATQDYEMDVDDNGVAINPEGDWLCYFDTKGIAHYASPSDIRFKSNIHNISEIETLSVLKNINIVQFNLHNNNIISSGIIAQELRDVLIKYNIGYRDYLTIQSYKDGQEEECIDYTDLLYPEEEIRYYIDYSKLVPLIWKGWQIHDNQIEQLNNTIQQLQQQIKELKEKLK